MKFRILGPLELQDGRRPVSIRAPKERALLGVLLLHPNEAVSTERLIDELWGERPPATAGKIVQTYVSQLRRRFGPELIETRPPGYAVPLENGALDANRFRELTVEARAQAQRGKKKAAASLYREALALWRGPPLADVAFESSARNEVARLESERVKALVDRIDCELALGLHEELVPELESLVAQHPLQERLRAQLMLALYRSSRQADALAAYHEARSTLVEELGLEPGPELHELERAMLRQDAELRAPARPLAEGVGASRRPWAVIGLLAALTAGVLAFAGFLLFDSDTAGIAGISPNAVGVIDPEANALITEIPVGTAPDALAVGAGALWVTSAQANLVYRIDPSGRRDARPFLVPDYPSDLAIERNVVWVALGPRALVTRISKAQGASAAAKPIAALGGLGCGAPAASIAVGAGSVWLACENGELGRVNPATREASRVGYEAGLLDPSSPVVPRFSDLDFGRGYLWIANRGANSIVQFDPLTSTWREINVGEAPAAIAVGYRSVWVANFDADTVSRVTVGPLGAVNVETIAVGAGPVDVEVGEGSVWTANSGDGTVSRIDPTRFEVVATIPVGREPAAIAVGLGRLWVTVRARDNGAGR